MQSPLLICLEARRDTHSLYAIGSPCPIAFRPASVIRTTPTSDLSIASTDPLGDRGRIAGVDQLDHVLDRDAARREHPFGHTARTRNEEREDTEVITLQRFGTGLNRDSRAGRQT